MSYSKSSDLEFKAVTTQRLREMKDLGIKISCLTAYDALIAKIFDDAGIDLILVGDSLGNVFQGLETTIPVTLEETIYHTKAVVRGAKRAMVVADMPFMSYQVSPQEAFSNAGKIMKETGANAVKLEGGERVTDAIKRMADAGIPVMGHVGLTPQKIHQYGSYKARGTEPEEAQKIFRDAHLLEEAGAFAVVVEKIPAELSKRITESLEVPVIGIGGGKHCDGQILVYTDMLGLTIDFNPRFVRRYADLNETIKKSVEKYTNDIRNGKFPNDKESY